MSRLRHTDMQSWIRAQQMSEHTLFIIVEGKQSDRYFYGKIAEYVCSRLGVTYCIILPTEIPGEHPRGAFRGKSGLAKIHEILRRSHNLSSSFVGERTVFTFFADKDVDDIAGRGRALRSPHFIYTKYYDAEAHIISSGNLIGCAAATASIDERRLALHMGNPEEWRRKCAEQWKEWIKVCIFCERYEAKGVATFHHESKVNSAKHGEIDSEMLHKYLADARDRTSLDADTFRKAYEIISKLVDRLFVENRYNEVFKGKWYVNFVEHTVTELGIEFDKQGLHAGLVGAMSSSLDPSAAWAHHFVTQLDSLLRQCLAPTWKQVIPAAARAHAYST